MTDDRFGLGFRPELAAEIMTHRERIDIVEVIADDYFAAPARRIDAVVLLARFVPVSLHGVGLGMASSAPVDQKRLDAMARLVERVRPVDWSEHLAFVRGGGHEIGHLAAPPRSEATIEGTARNVARAARTVGCMPLLENVATLIDPPASTMAEAPFLQRIAHDTGAGLLLDLHNLYANAVSFGLEPLALLDALPLSRVRAVHLAGGRWIDGPNDRRILDDHLHDVPDPVFDLLEALGARTALAARPLDVILERDGRFPPFASLLAELDRARAALARGRARPATHRTDPPLSRAAPPAREGAAIEALLARIYAGGDATSEERDRLGAVDQAGLELALGSFERKRSRKHLSR